ncbi:MAG: hypothetical protein ACJAWC_003338 [Yoonia sp.]|jgi:hypothetical protein
MAYICAILPVCHRARQWLRIYGNERPPFMPLMKPVIAEIEDLKHIYARRGSVAKFDGWFLFWPVVEFAFAMNCRRGTLNDH